MGKIKLKDYVYEMDFLEKTTDEPKVCPKCKSPYWNTPRKNERNEEGRKNKNGNKI